MSNTGEQVGTILIVDDEYFIQRSLAFMLRKEGFKCFCAGDGVVAMEMVQEHEPDLLILDLDLPRKDGYSVCREPF